jgi:hypothetical protein
MCAVFVSGKMKRFDDKEFAAFLLAAQIKN